MTFKESVKRYPALWTIFVFIPSGYEIAAIISQWLPEPYQFALISPQMWEVIALWPGVTGAIFIVLATLAIHFWVNRSTWILLLGLVLGLVVGFASC